MSKNIRSTATKRGGMFRQRKKNNHLSKSLTNQNNPDKVTLLIDSSFSEEEESEVKDSINQDHKNPKA